MDSFQPHIRQELDRFSEYIASLDEDYIILMARKALRLYELLVSTGSKSSNKIVLSQRVLDEKLDWVSEKRVAVVDDTLIVGTTLKEASDNLIDAGASEVNTYVFCADKEYWVEDLISPEKVFMKLSDREVMSFCASEVSAFERNGIPYISDFPISDEITIDHIGILNLIPRWRAYQITTKQQEAEGRHVITFLPDGDLYSEIEENLGRSFYNLVDIVKIRAIGNIVDGKYCFKIIPVFTFKPLKYYDLELLFKEVIGSLNRENILDKVFEKIVSPKGKIRCIQYVFSIVFGRVFMENFGLVSKSRQSVTFVESEIFRNYGPWLLDEFRFITKTAKKQIWKNKKLIISDIHQAEYPATVRKIVNDENLLAGLEEHDSSKNVITDVSKLFLRLHNDHEIPARKEAKKYAMFGGETLPHSKHRNRLKIGYPWQLIVEYLCKIYDKKVSVKYSNLFSLALDFWNDKGVAVPIVCEMDGVVFRAYRHGESAPYSNQEAGLCYALLKSYFNSREVNSVNHTELLKLLTILFRSGMKNGYIDIITGVSGSAGVAKIGYHLHGAIPFLTDDQNNLYADNKDNWISKYLVAQKALKKKSDGSFSLGDAPSANYYKPDSEEHAEDLGEFLGYFMTRNADFGGKLLSLQDLIKISTCSDLPSTVAAVNAELRISSKNYTMGLKHTLNLVDLNSKESINSSLKNLRNSELYTALHSAKMKILAYENDEIKIAVNRCCKYLKALEFGGSQARTWNRLMSFCELDETKEAVNDLRPTHNIQISIVIFLLSTIYTIEYSLLNIMRKHNKPDFKRIYRLLDKKVTDLQTELGIFCDEQNLKVIKRLQSAMTASEVDTVFDSEKTLKWAFNTIDVRVGEIQDQISITNRTLADHNTNVEPRTYFEHVLWYDIVDSTGTKAALKMSAESLRTYKSNVSRFRDSVNMRLTTICEEYSSNGNEVLPWNGTVESKNDEKHIFFVGKDRVVATLKAIGSLVNIARQCPGVRFRAALIPCDFTGDSYASSSESSAEVEGEVFLVHFDRLKKEIASVEDTFNDSHLKFFVSEQYRRDYFKGLKKIGMYAERELNLITTEGLRNNTVKLFGANIEV